MRDHLQEFRVSSMCRVLGVHRSGFYAVYQMGITAGGATW
jgi:hypothetical protein